MINAAEDTKYDWLLFCAIFFPISHNDSPEEGDSAVEHAHKAKLRKYEERCDAEAISFLPLAVDTFGGWHKVGLKTITRLGRQLARNLEKDEDEVVRHLRQRLGVLIVRDNAAMMASRHPTFRS